MDWENGKIQITNMALSPIMEICLEKKSLFEEISFMRVYREVTIKVDTLTKESLFLKQGLVIEHDIMHNILINEIHVTFYD